MKTQSFTKEEVKILEENKYTAFVSSHSIRFTLEFKQTFLEKRQQGVSARRIFQDLGYDPDILGACRIKNLTKRIKKEASSPGGLHAGYQTHKKHPNPTDYGQMPAEEALGSMQRELLYLRQELDFIKKIIKMESMGGQKQ